MQERRLRAKFAGNAKPFLPLRSFGNLNTCTATCPRSQFRTPYDCFGNSHDEKTSGVRGSFSLSAGIEKFCFHGNYMDKVSSNWLSR